MKRFLDEQQCALEVEEGDVDNLTSPIENPHAAQSNYWLGIQFESSSTSIAGASQMAHTTHDTKEMWVLSNIAERG